MYTTTYSSELPGPVTTVCVFSGGLCSFAHVGSFDMSIGFIFAGVPVYVTFPVMVPLAGGRADTSIADATSTTIATQQKYVIRIPGLLLMLIRVRKSASKSSREVMGCLIPRQSA
jgi:hypothetical protein